MSCSATYFPEVGAGVSLKVATKVSPKGENNSEILDFSLFFKAKVAEYNPSIWNNFDQIYITVTCSSTSFLEVGGHFSFEVATKVSRKGQKLWKFRFLAFFSKAKMEECNQKVWNTFN